MPRGRYWNILTSDLYHTECQFQPPTQSALVLSPIPPGQHNLSPTASPRRQLYSPVLSKLRVLLVSRMAKPEEVRVHRRVGSNTTALPSTLPLDPHALLTPPPLVPRVTDTSRR